MTRNNHIQDEIEITIQNAIEEAINNPKHGLITLVFSTWNQSDVELHGEEIADVISDYFDTDVWVDY